MQAVLVMFRSDGDRRSFSLTRDITVIGRREDCDLRIPLGEVSRKHCRLVRDGDMLRLEDLGSSNGTYHNGQRVQEAMLSPGDSIQVGPLVFVLQIDGVPVDEDLAPVIAGGEAGEEDHALADESPLQPTAQSEYGMGNLPELDQEPAELESLEPADEEAELTPLDESEELTEATPLENSEDADLGELAAAAESHAGNEDDSTAGTTEPLGLEAPLAADDLSFDNLESVPELESASEGEPHAEEPGPNGKHLRSAGDEDPLALDELDLEQAPLELDDDDEHHAEMKVDSEHESPHTH